MTDWRDHPLCAPRAGMPEQFWGAEQFDPEAFRELVALISPDVEIAALLVALKGVKEVVDVGGGSGLLTQTIAKGATVTLIEPNAEQRAQVPDGITVIDGRAEAVPLRDRATEAAIATWVLQFTDDPIRAIDELARIARTHIAIIQAAPTNDLVEVYNRQAAIAGLPPAHHGWLLAEAATRLERAGFTVTLELLEIPVRAPANGPPELASTLVRLHFREHASRGEMLAATESVIASKLATAGMLHDDGVLLRAIR